MTAVSDSPDPIELKDQPLVIPNPVFSIYPVCTVVYYSTNPSPNPSQLSMWLVNDNPFRPDADRIKDLEQAVKTIYSMIQTMESGLVAAINSIPRESQVLQLPVLKAHLDDMKDRISELELAVTEIRDQDSVIR